MLAHKSCVLTMLFIFLVVFLCDARKVGDDTLGECTDASGWSDAIGKDCEWYARSGMCKDGVVVGFWEGGVGYAPELNCCVCGRAPSPSISTTGAYIHKSRECTDTPGWGDAIGKDCKWYARSGMCKDGVVAGVWEGSVGYAPELNCCVCGRALSLSTSTTSEYVSLSTSTSTSTPSMPSVVGNLAGESQMRTPTLSVEDKDLPCAYWASHGECETNAYYMRLACGQSCTSAPPNSQAVASPLKVTGTSHKAPSDEFVADAKELAHKWRGGVLDSVSLTEFWKARVMFLRKHGASAATTAYMQEMGLLETRDPGEDTWTVKQFGDLSEQFQRDGYIVVKGVFSEEEIDSFSQAVTNYVKEAGPSLRQKAQNIVFDARKIPALRHLFEIPHSRPALQKVLQHSVFGNAPYQHIQRNEVLVDRFLGYHRDELDLPIGLYNQGMDLWTPDARGDVRQMVVVALYLQSHARDNKALHLYPGSHRCENLHRCDGFGDPINFTRRVLRPSKGDAVIFDARLLHRAGFLLSHHSFEKHRSAMMISYGAKCPLMDSVRRGFELRDGILSDNGTFGCGFDISGKCANWWVQNDLTAFIAGKPPIWQKYVD